MSSNGTLDVGLYVFEFTLEDYPVSNITGMNGISSVRNPYNQTVNADPTPLSQVPLQFVVDSEWESCRSLVSFQFCPLLSTTIFEGLTHCSICKLSIRITEVLSAELFFERFPCTLLNQLIHTSNNSSQKYWLDNLA